MGKPESNLGPAITVKESLPNSKRWLPRQSRRNGRGRKTKQVKGMGIGDLCQIPPVVGEEREGGGGGAAEMKEEMMAAVPPVSTLLGRKGAGGKKHTCTFIYLFAIIFFLKE